MSESITMQEAQFDIDELFFSITTHDSTIVACNETFIRISEYEAKEIIGSYHNLIRHESMPKVVFQTLWAYLLVNKPVVAYVKNKAKSGRYYWVLAAVFPVSDQFLSIRIKPSSAIFTAVKELYSVLLEAEKDRSLEEVDVLLLEHLNALGYRDYNHFMNTVLITELRQRQEALMQLFQNADDVCSISYLESKGMNKLHYIGQTLQDEYMKWFETIEHFEAIKQEFEEKSQALRLLAQTSILLSLNASIASYKLESDGETFGVLARNVRDKAKENALAIENIHKTAQELSEALEVIIFLISYLSLQMETVSYFISELCLNDDQELDGSVDTLTSLLDHYNSELIGIPDRFEKAVVQSVVSLESLETQVMYMGYIQVYGVIESSRDVDDRLGFKEIFSQLKHLIDETTYEVMLMRKTSEAFQKENTKNRSEFMRITKLLERFIEEISHIRLREVA